MKIRDVYKKYEIPPNLQEHMLSVTGVGYLIVKNWNSNSIDLDLVTRTCLLHDMGNIVKFDFDNLLVKVDNPEHWREVQDKFIGQYGKDAHEATFAICKELGQEDVIETIDKERELFNGDPGGLARSEEWEVKILYYSDLRVVPSGVSSLDDRVSDLSKRYYKPLSFFSGAYEVEDQLHKRSNIDVNKIDQDMIIPLYEDFLEREI